MAEARDDNTDVRRPLHRTQGCRPRRAHEHAAEALADERITLNGFGAAPIVAGSESSEGGAHYRGSMSDSIMSTTPKRSKMAPSQAAAERGSPHIVREPCAALRRAFTSHANELQAAAAARL